MPSPVEVLVGLFVVMGASAFAAVRMHYANRDAIARLRWRHACETCLFVSGPAIGAFTVGVLAAPTDSRWPGSGLLAYALLGFLVLAAGWNLAEWLHNRKPAASSLPIARAVTLPPRAPDTAGHWCVACKGPHVTSFCSRAEDHARVYDCPECGSEDPAVGPHHAWHCSGYQCETCGRIGKGLHVDENWAAHVCPAAAGGDALHGWCVCGEHTEYLKERAA